jgi:hypothetical protein
MAAIAFVDGDPVRADQGNVQIFWDALGSIQGRVALQDAADPFMLLATLRLRPAPAQWAPEFRSPQSLNALLSANGTWRVANCLLTVVPFRRESFELGMRP